MVGIFKLIGSGLVDRDCSGTGSWVGLLAAVDGQGL